MELAGAIRTAYGRIRELGLQEREAFRNWVKYILLSVCDMKEAQPDLIWFDNEGVYATPNYYVQKLFSQYLGEYTVKCECDEPDIKISAAVRDSRLIVKLVNVSDEDKES